MSTVGEHGPETVSPCERTSKSKTVFTLPELPRDDPSGLRVQLCPELLTQTREMEFDESSAWGLSTCVGASQVL